MFLYNNLCSLYSPKYNCSLPTPSHLFSLPKISRDLYLTLDSAYARPVFPLRKLSCTRHNLPAQCTHTTQQQPVFSDRVFAYLRIPVIMWSSGTGLPGNSGVWPSIYCYRKRWACKVRHQPTGHLSRPFRHKSDPALQDREVVSSDENFITTT